MINTPPELFDCNVPDLTPATIESGTKKIMWARRNMKLLAALREKYQPLQPLKGKKVGMSIHIEAKTANLAILLKDCGAEVYLSGCNALSTQDDVAAGLVEQGVHVYAKHGDFDNYTSYLREVLDHDPDVLIDDGGDLGELLHTDESYTDLALKLRGISEETTTGVHRYRLLDDAGRLLCPVINVNDANCKHLFDNRYGTGQSVWTAIMATTNLVVAGKTVVVAGYGMCGRGVAMRAKGLGAKVIVTEIDPVKASEAIMEGYSVMPMDQAAPLGDVFVTVTGCEDVIVKRHFLMMKDGAICCNAGHFDCEVSMKDLREMSTSQNELRNNIVGYTLENGNTICVIAEGRLVNLASGDGHPVEIMDMSFSLQFCSVVDLVNHPENYSAHLYEYPHALDMSVATTFLQTNSIDIDKLTSKQVEYMQTPH